jgi:DNA-binding MarR family transcriptional regulator/uncharacterized damage-inducible protein DinB
MELSSILGLSHPTIISGVKQLEKKGLVSSKTGKTDARVRLLTLSMKGKELIPKLAPIWENMRIIIEQINAEGVVDFWSGLLEFEASIESKPLSQRLLELKNRSKPIVFLSHKPEPWFDRKFDFTYLSTTPEVIFERLYSTSMRLNQMNNQFPESSLTKSNGKWSIKQNIGHLSDLEPVWIGRVRDIIQGKKEMRNIDFANKKTHKAKHNDMPLNQLISNFSTQRNSLIKLCQENYSSLLTSKALHPRLGIQMRIIDLLYFVAEHDDHHLSTIRHLTQSKVLWH